MNFRDGMRLRRCRQSIVAFNSEWGTLVRKAFKSATEYHSHRAEEVKVLNTFIIQQFLDQFGEGVYLWDGESMRRCWHNPKEWGADIFCEVLRPDIPRVFRRCRIQKEED